MLAMYWQCTVFNKVFPGCRLVDRMSWDRLLSTVGTLVFSYKRLWGAWSLALGLAAARLEGRRRLTMSEQENGYSQAWISGDAYAVVWPEDNDKCTAACGACSICLAAEQVTAPGCTSNFKR